MTRDLEQVDLANPAHCYFGIGDQQNLRPETTTKPLSSSELRAALNFHLLFNERLFLLAEDMLVNELLMGLLLSDYRASFEEGLFVPVLRNEYDSIRDCERYLSAGDLYNPGGSAMWRRGLAEVAGLRTVRAGLDAEEAYSHYTDATRKYLHAPGLLSDLGVTVPPLEVDNGVQEIVANAGRAYWRRSALFHFSSKLDLRGLASDARHLRAIASILYSGHFGGLLNQPVVFPTWYGSYIEVLSSTSDLGIGELVRSEATPHLVAQLDKVLPNTRRDDIAQLDSSDILELRRSPEFHAYIRALHESVASTQPLEDILSLLSLYLERVDDFVAERQSGLRPTLVSNRSRLALIRRTSAAGAVLSLADVATGGVFTPGLVPDFVLPGSALVLLVLDKLLSRAADRKAQERRLYWSQYCAADGTFASQLSRLRFPGAPGRHNPGGLDTIG